MPKIRRDDHGLFVTHGGRLYRPSQSRLTKPLFPSQREGSDFYSAENVRVIPVPGSPLAKVTDHMRPEMWFDHGAYDVTMDSNRVWLPWYLKPKAPKPPPPPKVAYVRVRKAVEPVAAPVQPMTVNGVVPPPARTRVRPR